MLGLTVFFLGKTLQKAFQDTLKDPELLADAKKTRLDIDPLTGEEIEKAVARMKSIPAATDRKAQGCDFAEPLI